MKLFYSILMIVAANSLCAQSQISEVVSSSGGSINNGSNTIVYNLGETIIGELSNNDRTVAHGHLSQSLVVVLTDINDLQTLSLEVFPNPVVSTLLLSTTEALLTATTIQIWDVNGRIVSTESLNHLLDQYEIDMSSYKEGAYFLTVQSGSSAKNTYRIIKN